MNVYEELTSRVPGLTTGVPLPDAMKLILDQIIKLEKERDFLDCLRACGVDNWDGYGDAKDMMNEDEE